MKMKNLVDKFGVVSENYAIAKDGSYIREKITEKKLGGIYIRNGYRTISIKINGSYHVRIKICHLNWMAHHGLIPKKYIIHHKDFKINKNSKLNDHIDNLECMTKSEHMKLHNVVENLSAETRKKRSESHSGKNHFMYGKHCSAETKRKLSIINSGKNNPMYGKHRSRETKEKQRKSMQKFTDIQVREIRKLNYVNKLMQKEIVEIYNCPLSSINGILQGYTYNPDCLSKQKLKEKYLS